MPQVVNWTPPAGTMPAATRSIRVWLWNTDRTIEVTDQLACIVDYDCFDARNAAGNNLGRGSVQSLTPIYPVYRAATLADLLNGALI